MKIRKMKIFASAAVLSLALLLSASAFAQLGDAAMTMGAMGAMNNNPIAQQSQMTQQAAAAVAGQPAAAAPAVTGAPAPVAATPGTPAVTTPGTPAAAVVAPPPASRLPADLHAPFKQSLFFSVQDIIAIQKAIKGQRGGGVGADAPAVIPMKRYISVSGIIYKSPDNWVVWINGQKVVPRGLGVLKELVEMEVQKDSVRLKWFDIGANNTLNIRMRPNQTYYIVEGLLLPGVVSP